MSTPNNQETPRTKFRREYLEQFATGPGDASASSGYSETGSWEADGSWQSCDTSQDQSSVLNSTCGNAGRSMNITGVNPINWTQNSSCNSESEWESELGSSVVLACNMEEAPRHNQSLPGRSVFQSSHNVPASHCSLPVGYPQQVNNGGALPISYGSNESALDDISDDFIRRPARPMAPRPAAQSFPTYQEQQSSVQEDYSAASSENSCSSQESSSSFQAFGEGGNFVQSSWQATPDRNANNPATAGWQGFDLRLGPNETRMIFINDDQIKDIRKALLIPRIQPVSPLVYQVGHTVVINGKMGVGEDGNQKCALGGACAGGQLLDGSIPQIQMNSPNRHATSVMHTPNASEFMSASRGPVFASTPFSASTSPQGYAMMSRQPPQAPMRSQLAPASYNTTPSSGRFRQFRRDAVDHGRRLNYSTSGEGMASPGSPQSSPQTLQVPNAPVRRQHGQSTQPMGNVRRLEYSGEEGEGSDNQSDDMGSPPRACPVVEAPNAPLRPQNRQSGGAVENGRCLNYSEDKEEEQVRQEEAMEDAVLEASLMEDDETYEEEEEGQVVDDATYDVPYRAEATYDVVPSPDATYNVQPKIYAQSEATTEPGTGRPMAIVGGRTRGYFPDENPVCVRQHLGQVVGNYTDDPVEWAERTLTERR